MVESSESFDGDLLPETGRILGIDFGTVRVGLAITDPNQTIASPLKVYPRCSEKLDREFFASLFKIEQIAGVVIGLPIHLSGDASPKSKEALEFGKWLQEFSSLPVRWIDERFTTSFAREALNQSQLSGKKRKAMVDKLAAQILLSAYLESKPRSLIDVEGKKDSN
jgi:putative holliday junction resolvase